MPGPRILLFAPVAALWLSLAGCQAESESVPTLPEGIHWDGQGVLSFRQGRHSCTMRFVRVSAGSFVMGTADYPRTLLEESPPRPVRVPLDFWLGATEVTREQWHAFSGERLPDDPNLPINRISWEQIQAFVKRVSQASGNPFRLPSEAEWEYACRAGSATPWPWVGDRRQLMLYGWYQANAGGALQPVAGRQPNPLGLYDMLGNAVEWTDDAASPTSRVLRGGSVLSEAEGAACTCRYSFPATHGFQYAGFRLATY
jgi:formylglycine-generating enzyme required for sulfatase activity